MPPPSPTLPDRRGPGWVLSGVKLPPSAVLLGDTGADLGTRVTHAFRTNYCSIHVE